MQVIKTITRLLIIFSPLTGFSQSSYLPFGSKDYHTVERLEIKQQRNTDLNFSTLKPYNRKAMVREVEYIDSISHGYIDSARGRRDIRLSKVDEYNMRSLLMNNSEWVTTSREGFESRKPVLKTFYKTKANFLEVNAKDFFLVVNPVLQLQYSNEKNNSGTLFLNSRGVTVRGMLAKKLGFSTYLTDNQERPPLYVQNYIAKNKAVPGQGFYKTFKTTGVDYFDARGSLTFNAAKYIDIEFGYDKNFIGNGYRSLFLSDFTAPNLFLKLNTRIWKLNYQNLFMELMPQFIRTSDTLLDRKYAAMHHLSMNVTKWLNIGLFEGVIFGRRNHFDFQYLNPIIFYRHIEGTIGSPDNALAGLDFKANIAGTLQVYGQLLLDEFNLSEIKKNRGWWANKFGLQLGAKYIDAFGIPNLDLQLEANRVRPFTYSHFNTVANYTHYNQPLAHPLGANFQEVIAIAQYQPIPKLNIVGKIIAFKQGLDSAGRNFGSDPTLDYRTRIRDEGFDIGSGRKATCFNPSLLVSYELKQNIFLEASAMNRNYKIEGVTGNSNTTLVNIGLRMNMQRRNYDF